MFECVSFVCTKLANPLTFENIAFFCQRVENANGGE